MGYDIGFILGLTNAVQIHWKVFGDDMGYFLKNMGYKAGNAFCTRKAFCLTCGFVKLKVGYFKHWNLAAGLR